MGRRTGDLFDSKRIGGQLIGSNLNPFVPSDLGRRLKLYQGAEAPLSQLSYIDVFIPRYNPSLWSGSLGTNGFLRTTYLVGTGTSPE